MPVRPDAPALAAFLNHLLALDPAWLQALVEHRPPCNRAIADHPAVLVAPGHGPRRPAAGLLGLLNGYLGSLDHGPRQGWGALQADYDDLGYLIRFRLDEATPPAIAPSPTIPLSWPPSATFPGPGEPRDPSAPPAALDTISFRLDHGTSPHRTDDAPPADAS